MLVDKAKPYWNEMNSEAILNLNAHMLILGIIMSGPASGSVISRKYVISSNFIRLLSFMSEKRKQGRMCI